MVRIVRIGILVLLSALLAWYLVSGQILLYIHERSTWLVALSVPVLVALAIGHVRSSPLRTSDRLALAILAIPLVVGIVVPGRPLGSAAIDSQTAAVAAPTNWQSTTSFTLDTHDAIWDMRGLLRALTADPELRGLEGQHASLLGFVYRKATTPSDQFLLSRFVIRCCTADAVALSFPVHYVRAPSLARDTWVQVDGLIQMGGPADAPIPLLEADDVAVVPPPSQPYLNP